MVSTVAAQPQLPVLGKSTASVDLKGTFHTEVMGKNVGDILEDLKKADEAKVEKRRNEIDQIDTRVKNLSSLEAKVATLSKAAARLSGENLGFLSEDGDFSKLVAVRTSGPDDVVLVTPDKKSSLIDIEIEVRQLAEKDIVSSTQGSADRTTALGWKGSFDVGILGKDSQTINLDENMTLEDVMRAVNAVTKETNIHASIITYPNESRLTFQALNFAEPIAVDKANLDGNVDLDAANKLPSSSEKSAEDLSAKVRYQGLEEDVVYASNKIPSGDQYAGLAMDLIATNVDNPVKVSIQNDRNAAGNAILDFVNAYNDLKEFQSSEEMYKRSGFDTLISSIGHTMAALASNVGEGDLKSLFDVGLQMVRPRDESGKIIPGSVSTIDVNTETLKEALSSKFEQVEKVFGFTQSSSNHHFSMIKKPESTFSGNVDITFTKSDQNELTATFRYDNVTYDAVLSDGTEDGINITAPENSPLKGFQIHYDNLASLLDDQESIRTTTISMTQGIADKLAKQLEPLLDPHKGTFKNERDSLAKTKKTEEKNLDRFEGKLAEELSRQINKFRLMEIAAERAKQSQDFIKTFVKTMAAAA